ncbi:MAG: hypothetical protein ACE5EZ_01105 [Thermodesulfobacteriota bacterium]
MKTIFSSKFTLLSFITVLTLGLITPLQSSAADKAAQKATKNTSFNVAFDMAHNEIFSPLKDDKLNYSAFYKGFQEAGGKTSVNERLVAPEVLQDLDTYVIAGPASPFITPEIMALQGFVHDGGSLLVLLHISSPVARLTESFGILVSNFVLSEGENLIEGKSQDFFVTDFAPSPVTKGLKKIALFGSWGLMAERGALVVARTSDKAWADLNRNRTQEPDEPVQSFGIVAVKEFGAGRVVVVADDAPFANSFETVGDNALLAENIINWFRDNPVKRTPVKSKPLKK